MEMTIKSVHFYVDDLSKELIESRLEKLNFAADKIVAMDFTLTREKDHTFLLESKIHFRWGKNTVVKASAYDLRQGINELTDKLDLKVRKEVEKLQDHKG
jgi:putative sigma-54 modulation protein